MLGYSVRYFRLSRLLLELTQAKADGTYYKKLKLLAKTLLIVIDDWGLEPLKPAHRNDLMEIMDDRHGHTSTTVISQLPTDEWYASIGDNTLAYLKKTYEWDWQGARDDTDKALQLEPNNADVIGGAASLVSSRGQLEKSIELFEHAVSLDPLGPANREPRSGRPRIATNC